MDKEKRRLSIAAARLYYQSDYSQEQIAAQIGLSRPTVSRLLQYAKEEGYVRIEIVDPLEDIGELEKRLKARFGLREVRVAHAPINEPEEVKKQLGRKAAELLQELVRDGDVIGVTWGTTMHALAKQLTAKPVQGVQVVQLKGGISHSQDRTYASEVTQLVATAFHAAAHYLPLPVIFDTPLVKRAVESDRHIQRIMELGRQANIALFTVGTVREDALLFRLGYLTEEEKRELQQRGVGDICSRFFDEHGELCSAAVNERTVGIELAELRSKECSVLIAGGERKRPAMEAALHAGFANMLVTDQFTAQALLLRDDDLVER